MQSSCCANAHIIGGCIRYYTTELKKQLDALLSKVPFLVNLRASDRSRITALMDVVHFEPGDVIIHANQPASSMCVIMQTSLITNESSSTTNGLKEGHHSI